MEFRMSWKARCLEFRVFPWWFLLFPVYPFFAHFTLWWPCRTQRFLPELSCWEPTSAGERAVVSIPGWWSHGSNCREPTVRVGPELAGLECALSSVGRSSCSLSQPASAACICHWPLKCVFVQGESWVFFVNLETNCQVLLLIVCDDLGIFISPQIQGLDCVWFYLCPCFLSRSIQLSMVSNCGN